MLLTITLLIIILTLVVVLLHMSRRLRKPDGYLRIDCSDPLRDIYRVDIDADIDNLQHDNYLLLRVDKKTNLQQIVNSK